MMHLKKSEESTLLYFNTKKSLTLHVDTSLKGLGDAILEYGKPLAFESKKLTDTHGRYSNIEREMLAIVLGWERYHTRLYGKAFTILSVSRIPTWKTT